MPCRQVLQHASRVWRWFLLISPDDKDSVSYLIFSTKFFVSLNELEWILFATLTSMHTLYRGLIRKEYSQSWKLPRKLRSYGENSTPVYSEKSIFLQ